MHFIRDPKSGDEQSSKYRLVLDSKPVLKAKYVNETSSTLLGIPKSGGFFVEVGTNNVPAPSHRLFSLSNKRPWSLFFESSTSLANMCSNQDIPVTFGRHEGVLFLKRLRRSTTLDKSNSIISNYDESVTRQRRHVEVTTIWTLGSKSRICLQKRPLFMIFVSRKLRMSKKLR